MRFDVAVVGGDVLREREEEGPVVLIRLGVAGFDAVGAERRGCARVSDVEIGAGGCVDGGVAGAGGEEEFEIGELGERVAGEGGAFAHGGDDGKGFEASD